MTRSSKETLLVEGFLDDLQVKILYPLYNSTKGVFILGIDLD